MISPGKAKLLLWIGIALWAVSWALPCHGKGHHGCECYTLTLPFLPTFLLKPLESETAPLAVVQLFAYSISPWTNLLFVASLVAAHYRKPLFRRLPLFFFGCGIVNAVWLTYGEDLRYGYFLWGLSFWICGFAVYSLARHPELSQGSPLVPPRAGASLAKALEAGIPVIALVVFLILGQTAVAAFKSRAAELQRKKEKAVVIPEPAAVPSPPDASEVQDSARRREEIWRFIEGYTQVEVDRAREEGDWLDKMKAGRMQSTTQLTGCDLTIVQVFVWTGEGEDRALELNYRVPLASITPSSLLAAADFTRTWRLSSASLAEKYPMAGLRLQTTNSVDSIVLHWRERKASSSGETVAWQQGGNLDEAFVGIASWKIDVSRVRNAFAELITLCGGQAEPF